MPAHHLFGGDKLFLPVENIDLLSRYGKEGGEAQLDKLGGASWQARKARIKGRVREIADQLIKVAAMRQTAQTEAIIPDSGTYAEFCQRFAWAETMIRSIRSMMSCGIWLRVR